MEHHKVFPKLNRECADAIKAMEFSVNHTSAGHFYYPRLTFIEAVLYQANGLSIK
jgi:hypothetical protein